MPFVLIDKLSIFCLSQLLQTQNPLMYGIVQGRPKADNVLKANDYQGPAS